MTGRKLFLVRFVVAAIGLGVFPAGAFTLHAAAPGLETTAEVEQQSPGRAGGPASPYPSLSWEWWNDASVQKELALSADKVKRINDFYERRSSDLRPILHEFVKETQQLEKMTRDRVVDESTYLLQVMRVEQSRARLNESRTVMLYRMFRELTPEQHQKLQDIMDRRFASRGGRGGRP